MQQTTHLSLDLLATSQAQKEMTVNEALIAIDAVLHGGVKEADALRPPSEPKQGDTYLLGASPVGAWRGMGHHFAFYHSGWRFIPPREGATYWVVAEKGWRYFQENAWEKLSIQSLKGETNGTE